MKQVKVILTGLEKQGCTVVDKKKGYMILFPDGVGALTLHKTPSDHRALSNARAIVLRAGLVWPLDPR